MNNLNPPIVADGTMYSYSRTDFGDAAAWGQKLSMRLHRPIFAPSCLPLKLVHQHKHDAGKIIPFFPPHLIIYPPHCPGIIFHPQ
jgi:hypothetical protein